MKPERLVEADDLARVVTLGPVPRHQMIERELVDTGQAARGHERRQYREREHETGENGVLVARGRGRPRGFAVRHASTVPVRPGPAAPGVPNELTTLSPSTAAAMALSMTLCTFISTT